MNLTLLGRAYCSLCDDMLRATEPLAAARGARVDVIDIDAHPALLARWDALVPVLFVGAPEPANELCHYHLDAARVQSALG